MAQATRAPILVMLGAVSAISYFERVYISILSPLIMEDLGLSQPEMGKVFSAFLLGYALCQYPSGSLADRFGSRSVLSCAMAAWGIITLATTLVQHSLVIALFGSFGALLVARFLLGVAEAPTYPASSRAVSSWFTRTEQARATSVFSVGMAVGSALAPPVVTQLMLGWGWKAALAMLSVPPFLLALLWFGKGGDGPRKQFNTANLQHDGVLRNKNVWLITISYFLVNYVFYVFVFWFFPYLVQVRHFDIRQSSWIASLPWILTIFATPVGGAISDWLVKRTNETWGRRLLPLVALPLAGLMLAIGSRTQNACLAVAGLTVCVGLAMLVDSVYWASAIRAAPQSAGRSGGLMNMGASLGGFVSASATPWIAQQVSASNADQFQGWITSLDVTAVMAVLGGLLWLGISIGNEEQPPSMN
jgi:MFS transporter, ACS family, glucarate transporter